MGTIFARFNIEILEFDPLLVLDKHRGEILEVQKVNLEVTKRSFNVADAMEFNRLPCHIKSKESFTEFVRET